MDGPEVDAGEKAALRASILEQRLRRPAVARAETARAIAAHLLGAGFARVDRVSAYLSMGAEPGTGPLIDALLARGTEVLVPVTSTERTLDWVD